MATAGLWTKVIAGSAERKTRLHDQRGALISASRLLRNGPQAVATGLGRLLFDQRPVQPWISYDAQAVIAAHLNRSTSRVLEFGSGMSTAWYARRSHEIVSIEDYQPWHEKVSAVLNDMGITNARYLFAATPEAYLDLARREAGDGFDLVMIDGKRRDRCAELAIELVRPGGMIYLDNADRSDRTPGNGDMMAARRTLLDFAERVGAETRWFTDFAPTQLFVQGGLLVTRPR